MYVVVELSILCTYKEQFLNGYSILFLLPRAKSEIELSFCLRSREDQKY